MTSLPPEFSPGVNPSSQISPGSKNQKGLKMALAVTTLVLLTTGGALVGVLLNSRKSGGRTAATAPAYSMPKESVPTPNTSASEVSTIELVTTSPTTEPSTGAVSKEAALEIFDAWTRNGWPTTSSLQPYFGSEPVDASQVDADAASEASRYSSSSFDATLRSITPAGDRFRVEVIMEYLRTGYDPSDTVCGSVISQMWLTPSSGSWLISGVDEIEPEVSGIGFRQSGEGC